MAVERALDGIDRAGVEVLRWLSLTSAGRESLARVTGLSLAAVDRALSQLRNRGLARCWLVHEGRTKFVATPAGVFAIGDHDLGNVELAAIRARFRRRWARSGNQEIGCLNVLVAQQDEIVAREGMGAREVASVLGVRVGSVRRALNSLHELGFVKTVPCDDGRRILYRATPAGRSIVDDGEGNLALHVLRAPADQHHMFFV